MRALALLVLAACGEGAAVSPPPPDAGPAADAALGVVDAGGAVDAAATADGTPPADATSGSDAGGLLFSAGCGPGERIVVAAVGDVLLHGPLQEQAYAQGFDSLWRLVAPLIAKAGVAYANLEGPTAAGLDEEGQEVPDPGPVFDDVVYTSFPRFNYHPTLIPALQAAGFDVVSTANNHALDRGALGVERTLDALASYALPATGTRRRSDGAPAWVTFTTAGGFKLAWLACAFSTNDPDDVHQVLGCDDDGDEVERIVRQLAARGDVDAVFVTPHGGDEYAHEPAPRQVRLAERVLDAGALAVIGNHPHVVQPWAKHLAPGGRETFVIYSIGNFVSGQGPELDKQTSLVLYLGLVRRDGQTRLSWVGYVPTLMVVGSSNTLWPADRLPAGVPAAAMVAALLDGKNALPSDAPLPVCR